MSQKVLIEELRMRAANGCLELDLRWRYPSLLPQETGFYVFVSPWARAQQFIMECVLNHVTD